jgi:tripartite-type tricarboxylate transporter receptor subunit TctC
MKRNGKIFAVIVGIGLFIFISAPSIPAADYPSRPITILNPYSPGGSLDLNCRIMAKYLGPILKQAVVVENRTGGGGVVGYTAVAKAPADGYMLTMLATPMIYNFMAIPGVMYTDESFATIAQLNYEPNLMMIRKGSKLDMPADKLFAYIRQHPNEITAGTGGRWASLHMATELLEVATGMTFRKVHFTGGGPALTNLLGGHVDMIFSYYSETFAHIVSGDVKTVAIASEKRSSFLPNTPTFKELGMDVTVGTWRGLGTAAGTPSSVLDVLENACKEVLKKPEVIEEFRKINLEVSFRDGKAFGQMIAAEVKKYKPIVERIKESKE